MTTQLHHLTKLSELPNVGVRVLPLSANPQPRAVAGSFVILDFPATKGGRAAPEPSVVHSESLTGALYLDKPDELAAYDRVWRGLDALALGEAESTDMIKQIAGRCGMTDLTGAIWRKSTCSGDNGGDCVEVATNIPGVVAVRDSTRRIPRDRFSPSPPRHGPT